MQVVPLVAGEALPQPREPVVSEQPTQHFSPELGLGTVVNATLRFQAKRSHTSSFGP